MKVKVNTPHGCFIIEVLPSDSVWTLKCKLYENAGIQKCHNRHGRCLPLSPDDQELVAKGHTTFLLDDCERSLESYSIHEGSSIACKRRESGYEQSFHSLVNVYRKKGIRATVTPVSLVKHVSIHSHEVRSIRLELQVYSSFRMKLLIDYVIHSIVFLKELDLSGNDEFGDEGWIRIAKALETNTSLKILDLSYCKIGSAVAIGISQMLEKNSSLVNLDLSWNDRIGDEGLSQIAKVLETNTSLKALELSWCRIGSAASIRIAQMLKKNSFLLILDLSWNRDIEDKGWSRIAEALENNNSLKTLEICGCTIGLAASIRIAQMLEKNSRLLNLDISGNESVGDEGWIRIAEALEINTSLDTLNMSSCGIGSAAAKRIAQMLEKNSSLIKLNLRGNGDIGDEGWFRITKALEFKTSLRKLNATSCAFGLSIAIKIAQMFGKNSSLVSLDLSGNDGIGDEGWIRITKALEANTSLKRLNLTSCKIGPSAAIGIAEMLRKNSSLVCLHLTRNNGIGNEGWIQIAESLDTNLSLETFYFGCRGEVHERIECLLLRNRTRSDREKGSQMMKKELEETQK
eukprot:TRINITY_DN2007_c1_g2_i5.p1 TRINITY_DN2007_c1_g2~~TRINITY_DN2007_c1_g2_i5.p1  ORF type:complete len:573 (-),score=126.82 TRINITY_DN2007_c1_g2_i5:169-1887(-)